MGAGQKVIGALLGHSDSASTERYTHVVPGTTAALVQARGCGLEAGRVEGNSSCERCAWRLLYFVYKRSSGFALEVQPQARGQQSCGENPRFPRASCAGTRLADMSGQLGMAYGRT
jgi:hypothetical protein